MAQNIIITNIRELIQILPPETRTVRGYDMQHLECIKDGFLTISKGLISGFGKMYELSLETHCKNIVIDARERIVMPAFCDSHTHCVFANWRESEFVDKLNGLTYEEIALRGGGILNSANQLANYSSSKLYDDAYNRLENMAKYGTGAVEIKSGYGLTVDSELKMLRVIKQLKEKSSLTIKSTFLGAHAIPSNYKSNPQKYIDLIINQMLPAVHNEQLADFVDVFCDTGFFSPKQTSQILDAAQKYGLVPKIHANELGLTGGVQVGVKHNALSVDHLEHLSQVEIDVLINSQTMPTVLPGASLFLGLPNAPIRKMIDQGLPIALASDYNPGSSPSGNMQLIVSLGSLIYRMLPSETIHATTINAAYAMGLEKTHGSITIGKKANIIITQPMLSINYLPYAFGDNKIETVILNGEIHHTKL